MICTNKGCKNRSIKGRRICGGCKSRAYRAKYSMKAAYDALKHNAKRRGKNFELTFDEFCRFSVKTDYIQNKGRTKESFSIDCIENEVGYVFGNIRAISLSENSKKGTKKLEYDWQTKTAFVRTLVEYDYSDSPF